MGIISIDTETVSLKDKSIVGLSIAVGNHSKYYPLAHTNPNIHNVKPEIIKQMVIKLAQENIIVGHNFKFDLQTFSKWGIPISTFTNIEDTMLIAHLLNENEKQGLKYLSKKYLNHQMVELKEIVGTGKNRISPQDADERILEYAADDARQTLALYNYLYPQLRQDDEVFTLYQNIEKPLIPILAEMEIQGIYINKKQVNNIFNTCNKKTNEAFERLEYIMPHINLNSSKQLREYFINKKGLKPLKLSAKTQLGSVDAEFLEYYKDRLPEIKLLLQYRKYNKILSTFIPVLIGDSYGKIYPQFRQSGTVSGRFSSSAPNLQNIPRDNDEFNIRKAIIATPGYILIGADYSGIELRIAAHLSNEEQMIKAFRQSQDIHSQTAKLCNSTRQEAKTINFGLLYGMRYKTLAKKLNVSLKVAFKFYNNFWKTHPALLNFVNEKQQEATKNKYVKTMYGRKRHLDKRFYIAEDWKKAAILRSLVNAVIQGSGADIIKMAMRDLYFPLKSISGRILLTEHDELLIAVPISKKAEGEKILRDSMLKHSNDFKTELAIDLKCGYSWSECH